MQINNRIEEIQEEYFEFCLTLLQKLPVEKIDEDRLASKAYQYRDQLNKAIKQNNKDFSNPTLEEINVKIKELKKELEAKE